MLLFLGKVAEIKEKEEDENKDKTVIDELKGLLIVENLLYITQ